LSILAHSKKAIAAANRRLTEDAWLRITRNSCDNFHELSSSYDQPHTCQTKHTIN